MCQLALRPGPLPDASPLSEFVNRLNIRAEWVAANDAYREGRARTLIGVRRPLDKLGEVIQKSEFDWVFDAFSIQGKRLGSTEV